MDIRLLDKNFDTTFTAPEDLEWFSIKDAPFSVHGVYYCEEEGLYRRMPKDVADVTSERVSCLSKDTAGGRVRFVTDSPYIALKVVEPYIWTFSHMAVSGEKGLTIYADKKFVGTIMPTYDQIVAGDEQFGGNGSVVFDGIKYPYGVNGNYLVEICMPLYSPINELFVGLKKGSTLIAPPAYTHKHPVLFYGSSITQGACATKPGDDYENRLSRKLDFDYINLGFSGGAKAEPSIIDYLVAQDPSVFVMDYDHNAPDAEYLKTTHFKLYEAFRKAHPTTPIVMMTMPNIAGKENLPFYKARLEVIYASYQKGIDLGDKNLYIVNCYGCFGDEVAGECGTVDDCHPDSLGFLRMAERLEPVLDSILNGRK